MLPASLLGVVLAGVVPLAADTENTVALQAGVAFQADFAATGTAPGPRSYTISGLPAGLIVPGAAYVAATNTYSVNAPSFAISGEPATAGSYPLTVTAWELANAGGTSSVYGYTITVGALAAGRQVPDAIVTMGHDVMFSAGRTAGALRWQISTDNGMTWSDLTSSATYSGVTGPVLTVAGAGASLNGAQYRFQAVDGGVVTVSNGARLTVAPALFPFPTGIVIDASGNLVVCDANTNTVKRISSVGVVTLLAGNSGTAGLADGAATAARFNQPAGLVVVAGAVFVADTANATLRRIATDGAVTTLAGSGSRRGSLDGTGPAALFSQPIGLAADAAGNLFVADAMNHTVRAVTATGVVSTLAGAAGAAGTTDGTGAGARFNFPAGVVITLNGSLVVADTVNHTLRAVTPAGVVTTLAGLAGVSGFTDGSGAAALFNRPGGLAVDPAGNLYVADTANSTIRRVTPSGAVTTVAGLPGVTGLQDGAGLDSLFNQPQSLTVDAAGNLYVVDTGNAAIRKVTAAGVVSTLALTAAVVSAPSPSPSPAAPNPTPAPAVSGGGGGGGAPSLGFTVLLVALLLGRGRGVRRAPGWPPGRC